MTKQELKEKIKEDGRDKVVTGGVLGDMLGCDLFEEDRRLENGLQTKYYGIAQWYNGIIDNDIIDRVSITKRAVKYVLKYAIPFHGPKKIIEAIVHIYRTEGGLKARELKMNEFCPAVRELVRVGTRIAERFKGSEMLIIDLTYCLGMFLQFSHTYRYWLQDISEQVDPENFIKQPLTEFLRVKRIFIGRLTGSYEKIEPLTWILFFAILFKKDLAREIVKEINWEKLKLDESDYYFTLRRQSYNFGGKDLYSRLVRAEQIDMVNNNIIL